MRSSLRLKSPKRNANKNKFPFFVPVLIAVGAGAIVATGAFLAKAQTSANLPSRIIPVEEFPPTIGSLKGAQPLKPDVSEYIVDRLAAQQLGKALFWDTQVGSDGNACASCHFHAGADIRVKNSIDPAIKAGDTVFNQRGNGTGISGPNKIYTAADFPFHRLANPNDRESAVLFDTNDIFGSQGTFAGDFVSSRRGFGQQIVQNLVNNQSPRGFASIISNILQLTGLGGRWIPGTLPSQRFATNEICTRTYDPTNNPFNANGLIYRKVEPRQTPTNINAVFNNRQFWDGRANNQFNGVDPFGPRTFQAPLIAGGPGNPSARKAGTLVFDPTLPTKGVRVRLEQRLIANASLASQAVGPALSDFEMSCSNKTFADLGRKLIPLRALANQKVNPDDSILSKTHGLISAARLKGLNATYRQLIQKAFNSKFWADETRVRVTDTGGVVKDATGFTQMEFNFSLFWGLAIQEYESLLISDDSPFDRAMNGNPSAMTDEAKAGEIIFAGKGGCINCHHGPLFTGAAMTTADTNAPKVVEHMPMGDGYGAYYDNGFYNIGVRPTVEDVGVGATDAYGFDLSYARQFKWKTLGQPWKAPDPFDPTPCQWTLQFWPCSSVPTGTDPLTSERDAVDGSFKTPTLRNVGLNPPYFHNGGQATLADVVRFYNRGGDRRGPINNDSSGSPVPTPFGQINNTNLDPDIGNLDPDFAGALPPVNPNSLSLNDTEMDYLVQFLLSLTDERVACHSDVFDHPELPLPIGQKDAAVPGSQVAQDIMQVLPATGKGGLKALGRPCFPNSGDLFGSINKADTRPLQATFQQILDPSAGSSGNGNTGTPNGDTPPPGNSGSNPILIPVNIGGKNTVIQLPPIFTGIFNPPATGTKGGTARPPANGGGTGTGGGTGIGTGTGTGTGTGATGDAVVVPPPPPVNPPVFSAPPATIHGFTTIGFIQNATVSGDLCPALPSRQWGGTATINNIKVVIPCNTVVQMPAATFTWADLFDPTQFQSAQSPSASLSLPASGTATGSGTFAFPSTEITINGNIVGSEYIAGLVYISQQSLNTSTGFIKGFDYAKGVIYVGDSASGPATVRLQLNDVNGRFSAGQSPDSRFNVDDQNPTIHSFTGYPMCVPRTDPAVADDSLCPQKNRPKIDANGNGCRNFAAAGVISPAGWEMAPPVPGQIYCSAFVMKAPPGTPVSATLPAFNIATAGEPDSRQQAPFEIGDFITYSGTLLKGDGQGPNGSDTISIHTINANVAIFTQPGTLPVYIAIGEFRVATYDPVTVFNGIPQEVQDRIVLEAFVSDVTSIVDIYLVDLDPVTGAETQRWVTPGSMTGEVGAIGSNGRLIDGGITTQLRGPQPGRARLRANKAVPGVLSSATRYVRVAVRSLCDPANINGTAPLLGSNPPVNVPCLQRAPAANGLNTGQYLAPDFNFIFPENIVPGDPIVANNFWALGFLANGEGPGSGPLIPTPW